MVAQNAFAGLAEEHSNDFGDAHLMSGSKLKWRREFNDVLSTWWDNVVNVAGMGAVPDPAGGVVTMVMGTTANAESWIVSKQMFTIPSKIAVGLQLSQKIINNEIYVELVGCDAGGNIDETRVAAWRIAGSDSLTTTVARSEVRNGAAARRQSANLSTVAQTGAIAIFEITAESDEVWFSTKAGDSNAARTVGTVMNIVAPDPEKYYKIRIRFKNGAVAPASSTTVTVQFALGIDITEIQAEVTGGNGNSALGQTIPVNVLTGSVSAVPANGGIIGATSVANLAAGATFTGTAYDNGASALSVGSYRVAVQHLAGLTPGTLVFEESIDATTYVETSRIPIPSDGLVHTFEFPITMRAARAKFINGATAQTLFRWAQSHERAALSAQGWALTQTNLAFPLAAGAVIAANTSAGGQILDLGANHQWNLMRATAFSPQTGTLFIEQSRDGATFRSAAPTHNAAIAAGNTAFLEVPIVQRYVRARILNGATATDTTPTLDASLISL